MTTLNNIQYRAYSHAQQLARFLQKNKNIYNTVPPFRNEVAAFLGHLNEVSVQAALKARKGTSFTIQKRELKKEIAREAANICNLATAYALTKGDKTLQYNLRYTYTVIYTLRDCEVLAVITQIINTITPFLAKKDFSDYGITGNILTSIQEKAKNYNSSIGGGKMLNFQSILASRNITAILQKIKAAIAQCNRLLILFKEKYPGFVEAFQQARIISQTDKACNAIEGTIQDNDTGQPLHNVTITAEGKNKKAVTNSDGFYHLAGIKTGNHKLTITAEGYAPQTISVKVIRGKTLTLNSKLESKHRNLPAVEVA